MLQHGHAVPLCRGRGLELHRAQRSTGLAPILKQQPGFKAYYIVRHEGGGGGSISLFDSAEHAKAAHERSLAWIKENLASMIGGATPLVTMGEVLAEVSAEVVA